MKNKKIIIIAIVLLLGALIVYALLTRPDGDIVLPKDKPELAKIDTYNQYVAINKIINDYYLSVSLNNDKVIKSLTGTDLLISNDKEQSTYYAKDVYVVKLKYNDYYYVSGTKMVFDYSTSKMKEVKDDCFLINLYKHENTFKITKIGNIHNYYDENELYDKVEIYANDYNRYSDYNSYSDSTMYETYINYFKDLLFVNYQEAYNLLDDSYKQKVGSIDHFIELREGLYNSLNNIVKNYSITGEDLNKTYTLILYNGTKITIKENGIMNVKYKIENN